MTSFAAFAAQTLCPAPDADPTPLPAYDVVIPCFDRAHVLQDAIESVLAQRHAASRIVVVDDGSTDDGAALIRRLADGFPAVVALLAPRNGGVAMARNIGLSATSAEWVAFLDSDDLWVDTAAGAMLAAGVRDRLDVVVGRFARIALDGTIGAAECGWDGRCIRTALAGGGVIGPSWSMVRRRTAYDVGGYDPSFRTCEDWDFFVRLAARGARFGRIDDRVAFYRTVAGQRLIDDDQDLAASGRRVRAHPYLAGAADGRWLSDRV